jgi:hypothetical protein
MILKLRPPASVDDSPRCLMLGFLVAQNWEGAEASGPRALRSSRSGIARGRSASTEWAVIMADVAVSEAYH